MKGLLCSIDPGRDKTGVALVHADGTLEKKCIVRTVDYEQELARLLAGEGLLVSPCASTDEFLDCYDPAVPACIVLDISMPGMSGLELQPQLQAHGIGCPVVFLTGSGDIPSSVQAMKAGALDFLTKPVDADALLTAVASGLAQDAVSHRNNVQQQQAQDLLGTLTPREREIIPHLLRGRLNKQIGADLGVAEKTIKVHRSRVMHKLGVRSPVELLQFLERAGQR